LKQIVLKELYDYVTDFKLVLLVPVILLLVIISTHRNSVDFMGRKQNQQELLEKNKKDLKTTLAYCQINLVVAKEESPLSILCSGINSSVDNILTIQFTSFSFFANFLQLRPFSVTNAYLNHMFRMDLLHVVLYFLSLMALLKGYDAISRERENGTLKLLSVTGISMSNVYIAKLASGTILIILVLLLCFISVTSIFYFNEILLTAEHWLRITHLFVTFFWYGLFWLAASQYLSLWTERSSKSLLYSMILWIVLLFAYPAVQRVFTGNPYVLLGESGNAVKKNGETYWKKLNELFEIRDRAFKDGGFTIKQRNEYIVLNGSKVFAANKLIYSNGKEILRSRWDASFLVHGMWKRLIEKDKKRRIISSLEPGGLLKTIGENICQSGTASHFDFMASLVNYGKMLDASLEANKVYDSPRWYTPVPYVHPFVLEFEKRMEREKFKLLSFDNSKTTRTKEGEEYAQEYWDKLEQLIAEVEKNNFVDVSFLPSFHVKENNNQYSDSISSLFIMILIAGVLMVSGSIVASRTSVGDAE